MPRVPGALLTFFQKPSILSCLASGIRCDGRGVSDGRDVEIKFSCTERGHAEVRMGETRVMCVVSGEVVKPSSDRPYDGFINFHVNLSPMASEQYEAYPSVHSTTYAQASEIAMMIETMLRRSRALDTEGLYIEGGAKVWSLSIDVHVLDDDGNVLDAAALAALAGLLHFRRNKEAECRGTSVDAQRLPPTPLSVHHLPVLVTLLFLEGSNRVFVVDPTRQEEAVATGQMSVAVNQFQELCGLRKSGGQPVDSETLGHAIRVAAARASGLIQELVDALKIHEERREQQRKNIWNVYGTADFPEVEPLDLLPTDALVKGDLDVNPAETEKASSSPVNDSDCLPGALAFIASRVADGEDVVDAREELRSKRRNVVKEVRRKQQQRQRAEAYLDCIEESERAAPDGFIEDCSAAPSDDITAQQVTVSSTTDSNVDLIPTVVAEDVATDDFASAVLPQQHHRGKRLAGHVKKRKTATFQHR